MLLSRRHQEHADVRIALRVALLAHSGNGQTHKNHTAIMQSLLTLEHGLGIIVFSSKLMG